MSAFLGTIRLLPGGSANVERVAVVRLGENTAEAAAYAAAAASAAATAAADALAAASASIASGAGVAATIDARTGLLATATAITGAGLSAGTKAVRTAAYTTAGDLGGAVYVEDAAATASLATNYPAFCKVASGSRYFRHAEPWNIRVEQAGVVAGEANSTEKILDAFAYARVMGGGKVSLTPGKTYALGIHAQRTIGTASVWNAGGAALTVPDLVEFDGTGAWLQKNVSDTLPTVNWSAYVHNWNNSTLKPDQITAAAITASGAATTTFPLDTAGAAAGYTVGDLCFYQLGSIAYDTPETYIWGFGKVTATDTGANSVTLDTRIPFNFDGTGNRSLWRVQNNVSPVMGNLNILSESPGGQNSSGLSVRFMRNPRIGRIVGVGLSPAFTTQSVDGFHVEHVSNRDTTNTSANRSMGMRFSESRGYVASCHFSNLYEQSIAIEGASDITVGYWRENDDELRDPPRKLLTAQGRSRLHIESAHITSHGYLTVMEESGNDKNQITFGSLLIDTSKSTTYIYSIPRPGVTVQDLTLNIAGTHERYIAGNARWHEEVIWLDDSATIDRYGPAGCVVKVEVDMLGGAVQGDVTSFYLGRGAALGGDIKSQLPATTSTAVWPISAYGGATTWGDVNGTTSFALRGENVRCRVTTTSGGSLAGSGKGIRVRWLVIPNQYAASSPGEDPVAGDLGQKYVLEGKKTYDFGSVGAGAVSSTTVTVTGAAVGDFADVSFSANPDNKLTCSAYVTGANTVTVALFNPTSGAITGPNATVRVRSFKPRLGN